jgi:hypothetical protein
MFLYGFGALSKRDKDSQDEQNKDKSYGYKNLRGTIYY